MFNKKTIIFRRVHSAFSQLYYLKFSLKLAWLISRNYAKKMKVSFYIRSQCSSMGPFTCPFLLFISVVYMWLPRLTVYLRCVFSCPPLMEITLRILESFLQASRSYLSKHIQVEYCIVSSGTPTKSVVVLNNVIN